MRPALCEFDRKGSRIGVPPPHRRMVGKLLTEKGRNMSSHSHHDRFLWGIILIVIGVLFLLDNFGYSIGGIEKWWPVILVLVGVRLIFRPSKSKIEDHPSDKEKS